MGRQPASLPAISNWCRGDIGRADVLRRGEGSDGGRQKLNEGWAFIKILILMLNQEEKNYFLLKIFLILMFLIGI